MKPFISKYGGILLGAGYGLAMRLLFNSSLRSRYDFTDLFSVTFLWIVPVLIGVAPVLAAPRQRLESVRYLFTGPIFSVFLFFVVAYITRIEDIICLVILGVPFIMAAAPGRHQEPV